VKIHVKLSHDIMYSLFYMNIHVTYAVRNFIFYMKIHVKIARLLTELFVMAKFFKCLM